MCRGIYDWYQASGYPLRASGLYIWQWGDSLEMALREAFPWLERLDVVDARRETEGCITLDSFPQAPCRACADVRRLHSDQYLKQCGKQEPVFLCRGHHLTDAAISILWRLLWYGPGRGLEGKGRPLAPLTSRAFLAKPLCFLREFESQAFAEQKHYTPLLCDCPAARFPARRDIVEESARLFYTGPLWEFDVPGMGEYIQHTLPAADISTLKRLSCGGTEGKKPCIPKGYFTFARDFFLSTAPPAWKGGRSALALESLAEPFLTRGVQGTLGGEMTCRLMAQPEALTEFELRMVGTLGPFWAAAALPRELREPLLAAQTDAWGFTPDIQWRQVSRLLERYYRLR